MGMTVIRGWTGVRRGMRVWGAFFAFLCLAWAMFVMPVMAQQGFTQLIVYGKDAARIEGDYDSREEIFISVPARHRGRLYVRLFDPDTNHQHDTPYGVWGDTRTRFTLFGGKGVTQKAGRRLASGVFGSNRRLDGRWTNFAVIRPRQGALVEGRRVFRLDVEGLKGNDGNVFDVTVSSRAGRNVLPEGARVYAVLPTVRVPNEQSVVELRFQVPKDAALVRVRNFDAAKGQVNFTSKFRTVPLTASGQDEWRLDEVKLTDRERGRMAAVTLKGGNEIPNDITVHILDKNGATLPIDLPIRAMAPNRRPVAAPEVTALSCDAYVLSPGKSSDPDGQGLTFAWWLPNAEKPVPGDHIRHVFSTPGAKRVRVVVSDTSGAVANGASKEFEVYVKQRPVARIAVKDRGAINEPVVFDASASTTDPRAKFGRFVWQFDDGTVREGVKVSHPFKTPGRHKIKLIAIDASGHPCDRHEADAEITINDPPVAKAPAAQHVTESLVKFDGTASFDRDGKIARYHWDFGDGKTATGPKPAHVYANPGRYKVVLTVADNSGTIRNEARAETSVVVNAAPIADAGPEQTAAPGETLTFDAGRSVDPDGKISAYEWDFGDGATARGKTARHAYARPGQYAVKLKIADDTGHDKAVDFAETRVVVNDAPVAKAGLDIKIAPGDGFTLDGGQSFDRDGKITRYRWDIADQGKTLEGRKVADKFDRPGVYKIQLTVSDDSGRSNGEARASINVHVNHAPVAKAGRDVATDRLQIVFDASGSADADGDALSYHWDFGDGKTATGIKVTHTYKKGGRYPVVLTVDDGSGLKNARARDALTVVINQAPQAVAGKSKNVCTGDVVVFDGSASKDPEGSVLRYSWDFGDGTKSNAVNPTKIFSKSAVYPVTLTVRDDTGLANSTHSDRVFVRVNQAPVANAGPDIIACTNTPVQFDGSKSFDLDGVVNRYSWAFGDGSVGGGDKPRHIYTRAGSYQVRLTVEGDPVAQCDHTAQDLVMVRVLDAPVARIEAPDAAPMGVKVAFDGSKSTGQNGPVNEWLWDFDDGATATGAKPQHAYAKAGVYTVTLTIKSAGAAPACRVIAVRKTITVNASPVADAGKDRVVSVGEAVAFDGSGSKDSDGGLTAYAWDFGDGAQAKGLQARHIYRKPGRYKVTLTVTDDSKLANDAGSDTAWVEVKPAPAPPVTGPLVACVGEPVKWAVAQAAEASATQVEWRLGDGTVSRNSELTHIYRRPGRYSVNLFVDQQQGPKFSRRHIVKTLHVNRPPVSRAGPDRQGCPGTPVQFDGTPSFDPDDNGKGLKYAWDFGDGKTSTAAKPAHVFARPGTYKVTLAVEDAAGSICSFVRDEAVVVINAPPVAKAGPDITAFVGGAHDAVVLDGTRSVDPDGGALTFKWQVGEGQTLLGAKVKHMFAQTGEVPVKLTVSDASGLPCGIAHDELRVKLKPRP